MTAEECSLRVEQKEQKAEDDDGAGDAAEEDATRKEETIKQGMWVLHGVTGTGTQEQVLIFCFCLLFCDNWIP